MTAEAAHEPPGRRITIPAIAADGSLYPIEKLEAHRRGVLHLAVSVFLVSDGKLLIQRRAAGKYHCGGLWANTVCSHPHWDEPPAAAARRRLREELGIGDVELVFSGELSYRAEVGGGLVENEHVHLFYGSVAGARLVAAPDPAEVSETRWATHGELAAAAAVAPESLAPWFRIYLEKRADLMA